MDALVIVLALVISGVVGSFLVPAVLALAPSRTSLRARAASLLRGGLVIGVLERIAVTGGILVGHPEAVAVVIAVKGLGRYPELRGAATPQPGPSVIRTDGPAQAKPLDPVAAAAELGAAVSERFIIGTLTSLLWSAACGVAGVWLLARGAA